MALYYIEEVSSRKEDPRRFVTERRGHYFWAYKDGAKKYTPKELMAVLVELDGGTWALQPIPVEVVEHEPT